MGSKTPLLNSEGSQERGITTRCSSSNLKIRKYFIEKEREKFEMKNFWKELLKVHNNHGGFEFNRSIQSRFYTAAKKHAERNGWTKHDDLTIEEFTEIVLGDCGYLCPLCGFKFNTWERGQKEGYNWEVGHINPDGYFTKDNIQLLHKRCNGVQWKDVMDFKALSGEFNCFLDLIGTCLRKNLFTKEQKKTYKNYINLFEDIKAGYDPRTSGGR